MGKIYSRSHCNRCKMRAFGSGKRAPCLSAAGASTAEHTAETRQEVLAGSPPHRDTAGTALQHHSPKKPKFGPTLLGQAGARLRRVSHTTRQQPL